MSDTSITVIYHAMSLTVLYFLTPLELLMNSSLIWFMVIKTTFNTISVISWRSVLLVEEIGENQRPVASHRQTIS